MMLASEPIAHWCSSGTFGALHSPSTNRGLDVGPLEVSTWERLQGAVAAVRGGINLGLAEFGGIGSFSCWLVLGIECLGGIGQELCGQPPPLTHLVPSQAP